MEIADGDSVSETLNGSEIRTSPKANGSHEESLPTAAVSAMSPGEFEQESKPNRPLRNSEWQHQGKKRPDWGKRGQQYSRSFRTNTSQKRTLEKPKDKEKKFIYGNFHHYYGYRNQDCPDMRLACMKREWFEGKSVLDIGCNAGHFTLAVARYLGPKVIIGMDIDGELIEIARKNTKHYIDNDVDYNWDFPLSCVTSYGPIAQAVVPEYQRKNNDFSFPFNVSFIQGNYILPRDEMIQYQKANMHTILCLSLTKWIHLNWGDDGIKSLFYRIYQQLKYGGHLILEAQPFASYAKKKKLSEELKRNYASINFFPEEFNEYLLKEVGFTSCELIDTPAHTAKGFSRPIYLFTKSFKLECPKDTPCVSSSDVVKSDQSSSSSSSSDSEPSEMEELSD